MSFALIFAGFGGQGILYMGQALAHAACDRGLNVCWLPSYGPEMRGGTANCMVTVSPEEVYSPMVLEADAVVAMNKPSMERFEKVLKPGGVLIVNSDLVDEEADRDDVRVYKIAADSIAESIKSPKSANMAALGALLAVTGCMSLGELAASIREQTPPTRMKFLETNLKALSLGFEAMKEARQHGAF